MIFDGFDKNNLMNGCPVKTVVRAGRVIRVIVIQSMVWRYVTTLALG